MRRIAHGWIRPSTPGICRKKQAGFTLIELSIVLVIIGLIVGGVLVGRDLIAQAELSKLFRDVQRYETAVNTFRDKYSCIPGDCVNATNFFGVASAGCHNSWGTNTGRIVAPGGAGTCNGNGNGAVALIPEGVGTDRDEAALVFNHLSLAGLVAGSYDGTWYGGSMGLQAGANVPYTIRNGGIDMMNYSLGDTSAPTVSNAFSVSSLLSATVDYSGGGLLTTLEAQAVDTKYDDGSPITGNITAGPWTGWGVATDCMASPHVGGTYDLTKTSPICGLYFAFGL